jgi:hypothetical protein
MDVHELGAANQLRAATCQILRSCKLCVACNFCPTIDELRAGAAFVKFYKQLRFELRLFTIYLQKFKIKNLIFFKKYVIIYIENKK